MTPARLFVSLLFATVAMGLAGPALSTLPLSHWLIPCLSGVLTLVCLALLQHLSRRRGSSPTHSDASRRTGTVKWFNATKGFGFIVCEDGDEVFVHFRALRDGGRRTLRDGLAVSFATTSGDRGPQASDVELVKD